MAAAPQPPLDSPAAPSAQAADTRPAPGTLAAIEAILDHYETAIADHAARAAEAVAAGADPVPITEVNTGAQALWRLMAIRKTLHRFARERLRPDPRPPRGRHPDDEELDLLNRDLGQLESQMRGFIRRTLGNTSPSGLDEPRPSRASEPAISATNSMPSGDDTAQPAPSAAPRPSSSGSAGLIRPVPVVPCVPEARIPGLSPLRPFPRIRLPRQLPASPPNDSGNVTSASQNDLSPLTPCPLPPGVLPARPARDPNTNILIDAPPRRGENPLSSALLRQLSPIPP